MSTERTTEAERELMVRVGRMLGYEPLGMTDLLRVLAHPDLIDKTMAYLESSREMEQP